MPSTPSSEYPGFLGTLLTALALLIQGCVVYEPVHPVSPVPSTYDRAWDSAVRAAQDSGIRLTNVDRNAGLIEGSADGIAARISVTKQADGTTRVEMKLDGDLRRDPTLSSRFQATYNRYMGR
jgi:hypothetical protein